MCATCDAISKAWSTTQIPRNEDTSSVTGSSAASKPSFSLDMQAHYLTTGYWHDAFGGDMRHFDVTAGGVITVDIASLSASAQSVAREALQTWTAVTGISFVETTGKPDIEFSENPSGAWSNSNVNGNLILDSVVNVGSDWVNYGKYYLQSYIHEIGHALGLGHAGNYNNSANFDSDAVDQQDSWQYSVMSYFVQTANPYSSASSGFVATPMLADIVAIQSLYGTPTTTRTGDDVYGDNATIDTPGTKFDSDWVTTIYDNGGIDTIDVRSNSANQLIDLGSEKFSNINGGIENVAIGRGVTIENAMTGAGNDILIGNTADNVLDAGAGNDRLEGGAGNDSLYGGLGSDILLGGDGNDTAFFGASAHDFSTRYDAELMDHQVIKIVDAHSQDIDSASDVEQFNFTDKSASLDEILMALRSRYGAFNSTNQDSVTLQFSEDLHHTALTEDQAQVARLYTLFGRTPDYAGLNHWLDFQANGHTTADIASQFIASGEFISRYGLLNDNDFVENLFTTVLHRSSDTVGLNYWSNVLQAGGSRISIAEQLVNSLENQTLTTGANGFIKLVSYDAWNSSDMTISKGQAYGTAADDQLSEQEIQLDTTGNAQISGGSGIDTLLFNSSSDAYDIASSEGNSLIINRTSGTPANLDVSGFNILQFTDRAVFVLNTSQAEIARIYTVLDRTPDIQGLQYWLKQNSSGVSDEAIADKLVLSDEMRHQLPNDSNQAFVSLLYRNVLEHEGDVGGINFWTHQLDTGVDRGQIALAIANAPEAQNLSDGSHGFIQLVGQTDWV